MFKTRISFTHAATLEDAIATRPWATCALQTERRWIVFESLADLIQFRQQLSETEPELPFDIN